MKRLLVLAFLLVPLVALAQPPVIDKVSGGLLDATWNAKADAEWYVLYAGEDSDSPARFGVYTAATAAASVPIKPAAESLYGYVTAWQEGAVTGKSEVKTWPTADYDYALPEWVDQTPGTALIASGPLASDDRITQEEGDWARTYVPKWGDIQPTGPDSYTWTNVDNVLDTAVSGGYKVHMTLYTSAIRPIDEDYDHLWWVPQWVFAPEVEGGLGVDFETWTFQTANEIYVVGWHPDVRAASEAFIEEFVSRYAGHAGLYSINVGAISYSTGEEWAFNEALQNIIYDDLESDYETLVDWVKGRMDAYESGAGENKRKVSWVGGFNSNWWVPPYTTGGTRALSVTRLLLQAARYRGFGNRYGNLDRQWANIGISGFTDSEYDSAFAQYVIRGSDTVFDHRHGYLCTDDSHPVISSDVVFFDENEGYGHAWIDDNKFGPVTDHPSRFHITMLRAVSKRLRAIWVNSTEWPDIEPGVFHGIDYDRPLTEYVRLSLGKLIDTSPDAWSRLLSTPASLRYVGGSDVVGYNGTTGLHLLRNVERWLLQRDVAADVGLAGGITVPVDRRSRTFEAEVLSSAHNISANRADYFGRRTDIATGNPCVYFHIEDGFDVTGPVEIRVTYRDTGSGIWWLEYDTGSGFTTTHRIFNQDTDTMQTVLFEIDSIDAAGGWQTDDYDFDFPLRLVATEEDLHVYLVRLTRWLDGPPAP